MLNLANHKIEELKLKNGAALICLGKHPHHDYYVGICTSYHEWEAHSWKSNGKVIDERLDALDIVLKQHS